MILFQTCGVICPNGFSEDAFILFCIERGHRLPAEYRLWAIVAGYPPEVFVAPKRGARAGGREGQEESEAGALGDAADAGASDEPTGEAGDQGGRCVGGRRVEG